MTHRLWGRLGLVGHAVLAAEQVVVRGAQLKLIVQLVRTRQRLQIELGIHMVKLVEHLL